MPIFELDFWVRHQRALGVAAIIIGIGAWGLELSGVVYVCPYCRVQRTVIMILGAFMLLPQPQHWIAKYVGAVIGFLGAVVAANQHFMSWAKISKGEFSFGDAWYMSPFLLSACALFIIIAQVWFIVASERKTTL